MVILWLQQAIQAQFTLELTVYRDAPTQPVFELQQVRGLHLLAQYPPTDVVCMQWCVSRSLCVFL